MEPLEFNQSKEGARNKSKLSYADCCIRLTGDAAFEAMSDDDLDSIYCVAFGQWAYHMSRQGYINSLNKERAKLLNQTL